jgi:hypothetical protein
MSYDIIYYCRICGHRWVGEELECDQCGSEHIDVFNEDDIAMEMYENEREEE